MLASWPFAARFSNCSNSLNFEAKINYNTSRQNELKWRKTCTGLKFDLEHFNGPKSKFFRDSLYEHPVVLQRKKNRSFSSLLPCFNWLIHPPSIIPSTLTPSGTLEERGTSRCYTPA